MIHHSTFTMYHLPSVMNTEYRLLTLPSGVHTDQLRPLAKHWEPAGVQCRGLNRHQDPGAKLGQSQWDGVSDGRHCSSSKGESPLQTGGLSGVDAVEPCHQGFTSSNAAAIIAAAQSHITYHCPMSFSMLYALWPYVLLFTFMLFLLFTFYF